jgi:predicted RecB family endonuclease
MKKIILIVFAIVLTLTATGCQKKEIRLSCEGNKILSIDVCTTVKKDLKGNEEVTNIDLCNDTEHGNGKYTILVKDGKVIIEELREVYNEEYTKAIYRDKIKEFYDEDYCKLEESEGKLIATCENLDVTDIYKNYNTIEDLDEVLEVTIGLDCNY